MAVKSSHVLRAPGLADAANSPTDGLILRLYQRFKVTFWFAIAAGVVYIGYDGREQRALDAGTGLGYGLGIFALACMLVLLLYPLRKRITLLRFLGPAKDWFRNHQVLGIIAPIAALYHCNFELGSLNTRIALYSALLVAGSGIIGRFIYTKISRGLNKRKASLRLLAASLQTQIPESGRRMVFLTELVGRVAAFDAHVLAPQKGLFSAWLLPLRLIFVTRREQWRLARFARRKIVAEALYDEAITRDRRKILRATRRCVAQHLRRVRSVAELTAYQRLFALWHIVHMPFFLLLVVSVAIHVYAVNTY